MLRIDQKRQIRKDMLELAELKLELDSNPLIPAKIKQAINLQMRIIESLSAGLDVFTEGVEGKVNHG